MEQNGNRDEILKKLKEMSSECPSNWRDEAQWRRDNREWLRVAGTVCVYVMVNQENPREFVKGKLGCDDGFVDDFMKGRADLKLSEIMALVGFDEFSKMVARLRTYKSMNCHDDADTESSETI